MSIERINAFIDKNRIKHSSCIVKELQNTKYIVQYVVVACTMETIENLLKNQDYPNNIIDTLIKENIINNKSNINGVVYYGNLLNFTQYRELVYKFPIRKIDLREGREPRFRLYTRTIEYQKEMGLVMNLCPTAELSWKSVIDKVGSKTGLILQIKKKKC